MSKMLHILIAEDDVLSQELIRGYLQSYGECVTVDDGESAIREVENAFKSGKPFNLVCMDIMMPNIDGIEAVTTMRDMEKDFGVDPGNEVQIIMITAIGDSKTIMDSFYKHGVNSYIVKPLIKEKLDDEIKRLGLI